MMRRDLALRLLARHLADAIVVATIGPAAWDWARVAGSIPSLTGCGEMGLAAPIGLGLAMARPRQRVVVLDGDGALLMNLGVLATIAAERPPNLVHVLLANDMYESGGQRPVVNAGRTDWVGLARAAGIPVAERVPDLGGLRRRLPEILRHRGPAFLVLPVTAGPARPVPPEPDYVVAKERFAAALERRRPRPPAPP